MIMMRLPCFHHAILETLHSAELMASRSKYACHKAKYIYVSPHRVPLSSKSQIQFRLVDTLTCSYSAKKEQ